MIEKGLNQHCFLPGTERYTRPEEVKALNRFLKSVKDTQEEHTTLQEDNLEVPWDRQKKPVVPDVEKLEDRRYTVEGDLKQVQKLEDYQDQIKSNENVESLETYKEKIESNEEVSKLEDYQEQIKSNENVEDLETYKEKIESNEEVKKLEDYSENLPNQKKGQELELETKKEKIEGNEDKKSLEDHVENIKLTEEQKELDLSNYQDSLELQLKELKTLSETREDIKLTEEQKEPELSKHLENIEDSRKTELQENSVNLKVFEDGEEKIELEKQSESLEVNTKIELQDTLLKITPENDPELSKKSETIEVKQNYELSEYREKLQGGEDQNLDTTRLDIQPTKIDDLDNTKEKLQGDLKEQNKLKDQKETISENKTEDLDNHVEKIEDNTSVKLSDSPEELVTPKEEVDLNTTKSNLIVEEKPSQLSEEKRTLNIGDNEVDLETTQEILQADNDQQLSDTKENVPGEITETTLSDYQEKLTQEDEISSLPDYKEEISEAEEIPLSDTKELLEGTEEDISLSEYQESLEPSPSLDNELEDSSIELPSSENENSEVENLEDTSITLEPSPELDNELEDYLEELIPNQGGDVEELSDYREEINKPEDVELEDGFEELSENQNPKSEDVELSDYKENITGGEDVELSDYKEDITKGDDVELENKSEDLLGNVGGEAKELSDYKEELQNTDLIDNLGDSSEILPDSENPVYDKIEDWVSNNDTDAFIKNQEEQLLTVEENDLESLIEDYREIDKVPSHIQNEGDEYNELENWIENSDSESFIKSQEEKIPLIENDKNPDEDKYEELENLIDLGSAYEFQEKQEEKKVSLLENDETRKTKDYEELEGWIESDDSKSFIKSQEGKIPLIENDETRTDKDYERLEDWIETEDTWFFNDDREAEKQKLLENDKNPDEDRYEELENIIDLGSAYEFQELQRERSEHLVLENENVTPEFRKWDEIIKGEDTNAFDVDPERQPSDFIEDQNNNPDNWLASHTGIENWDDLRKSRQKKYSKEFLSEVEERTSTLPIDREGKWHHHWLNWFTNLENWDNLSKEEQKKYSKSFLRHLELYKKELEENQNTTLIPNWLRVYTEIGWENLSDEDKKIYEEKFTDQVTKYRQTVARNQNNNPDNWLADFAPYLKDVGWGAMSDEEREAYIKSLQDNKEFKEARIDLDEAQKEEIKKAQERPGSNNPPSTKEAETATESAFKSPGGKKLLKILESFGGLEAEPIPKYKLPEFNLLGGSLNINQYLRWAVENTIGLVPVHGALKKTLIDETLALLILARDEGEKLLKSNRERLPGNSLWGNALANVVQGGVSVSNLLSTGAGMLSSLANPINDPVNRPDSKEETSEWESPIGGFNDTTFIDNKGTVVFSFNGDTSVVKDVKGTTDTKKREFQSLVNKNIYTVDPSGEEIGIGKTLKELINTRDENSTTSLEGFKQALVNSRYFTVPEKFTSTSNTSVQTTLDSNHTWEIIFKPYIGSNNGYCTWLPSFLEIDKINKTAFNISTRYSCGWLPITGYTLQSNKLTSKDLPLFDGNISYPISMEFTNELKITFADDSLKSLRRYFDLCAKVSVYMSSIHNQKEYEDDNGNIKLINDPGSETVKNPTVYLEGKVHPGLYKNLSFLVSIYILTPQFGTIKKCELLCVMKDYMIENQGEVDSSPTDLEITFSIVGENPIEEVETPVQEDSYVPPARNPGQSENSLLAGLSGLASTASKLF